MNTVLSTKTNAATEFRSSLLKNNPLNPALQRLKQRVLIETDHSQIIISYDRMHHRHNRS